MALVRKRPSLHCTI